MDLQKTKEYYDSLTEDDLCQCSFCRNFTMQIKERCPLVSDYLQNLGIDITKPFESWPLEPDGDGNTEYLDVQYIVFGDKDGFMKTEIAGTEIRIAESHPFTGIEEEHFVIEASPFHLKWILPEKAE